jgi:hypothetical protein
LSIKLLYWDIISVTEIRNGENDGKRDDRIILADIFREMG